MNGIKENQGKFLKIETVMCQVENTLDKTAVRWGGGGRGTAVKTAAETTHGSEEGSRGLKPQREL